MNAIRKLMTIPVAIAGCITGLVAAQYGLFVRAYLYCPPQLREGSDCYLEGWNAWPEGFLAVFAALSAMLCISLAAIVAPARKAYWAGCALIAGAVLATFVLFITGLVFSYFAGLLCGVLSYAAVKRATNDKV